MQRIGQNFDMTAQKLRDFIKLIPAAGILI